MVSAFPVVRGILYMMLLIGLVVAIIVPNSLYTLGYMYEVATQNVGVTKAEACIEIRTPFTSYEHCEGYNCKATKAHLAFYVLGMILLLVSMIVGFIGGGCCGQKIIMVIFDLLTFLVFALTATIVILEKSIGECLLTGSEQYGASSITWKFGLFVIIGSAVLPFIMCFIDCCWSADTTTTTTVVTNNTNVYAPHQAEYQQMQYDQPLQPKASEMNELE